MTTDIDLDAIEACANAATGGPWIAHPDGLVWTATPRIGDPVSGSTEIEDAEFIAAARDDVPQMAAEIRRLREQLFAQKPVIGAAQAWAETLETDGSASDLASKLIDLHDAVEQCRLMDLALTAARTEQPEATR